MACPVGIVELFHAFFRLYLFERHSNKYDNYGYTQGGFKHASKPIKIIRANLLSELQSITNRDGYLSIAEIAMVVLSGCIVLHIVTNVYILCKGRAD